MHTGGVRGLSQVLLVCAAVLLPAKDAPPAVADRGESLTGPQRARERMVREQLEARDIRDPLTLAAMREVPRHELVPEDVRADAYDDAPLPIAHGQTISQPYVVAFMTQALGLRG